MTKLGFHHSSRRPRYAESVREAYMDAVEERAALLQLPLPHGMSRSELRMTLGMPLDESQMYIALENDRRRKEEDEAWQDYHDEFSLRLDCEDEFERLARTRGEQLEQNWQEELAGFYASEDPEFYAVAEELPHEVKGKDRQKRANRRRHKRIAQERRYKAFAEMVSRYRQYAETPLDEAWEERSLTLLQRNRPLRQVVYRSTASDSDRHSFCPHVGWQHEKCTHLNGYTFQLGGDWRYYNGTVRLQCKGYRRVK